MNSVPVFNLRPPVEMRTGHVDATLDGPFIRIVTLVNLPVQF